MKVAYFSPFPPKQTGIARCSDQLVGRLRKLMEVDCYDCCDEEAGDPSVTFGVGEVGDLTGMIEEADAADNLDWLCQ